MLDHTVKSVVDDLMGGITCFPVDGVIGSRPGKIPICSIMVVVPPTRMHEPVKIIWQLRAVAAR